jgi:hypothetical protein
MITNCRPTSVEGSPDAAEMEARISAFVDDAGYTLGVVVWLARVLASGWTDPGIHVGGERSGPPKRTVSKSGARTHRLGTGH